MLHSVDSIQISQHQQSNEVSSAQNSQHNNQEQIPPSIKKRYAINLTLDAQKKIEIFYSMYNFAPQYKKRN